MAQKLFHQSVGASLRSSKPSAYITLQSSPTSSSTTSSYITPTSSLAPSPPKSYCAPGLYRPHPSWPLEDDVKPYDLNESLNHSRSLPNSLPSSRHASVSNETNVSTSGAWTLF